MTMTPEQNADLLRQIAELQARRVVLKTEMDRCTRELRTMQKSDIFRPLAIRTREGIEHEQHRINEQIAYLQRQRNGGQ